MGGTRHQFAPPMAIEQAVHGAVIDLMSHSCLKSLLHFRCRSNFSGLGTCEERCQEVLFFFQRQIDITTASLAGRFKRSDSKPIVEGDTLMNCRFGNSAMFDKLFRFTRFNQSVSIMSQRCRHQGRGSFCNRLFTSSRDT